MLSTGALFQLFCCSFSGLFSILATCPNFGEQFKHIPPVAALSVSHKCTDALYSRSRSYSVSMSFPAPLSLHHYFVVAARMQHHFESNLVAVEESGVARYTIRISPPSKFSPAHAVTSCTI